MGLAILEKNQKDGQFFNFNPSQSNGCIMILCQSELAQAYHSCFEVCQNGKSPIPNNAYNTNLIAGRASLASAVWARLDCLNYARFANFTVAPCASNFDCLPILSRFCKRISHFHLRLWTKEIYFCRWIYQSKLNYSLVLRK